MTEFRDQARAWITANLPQSIRISMHEDEIRWGGRKARFAISESKLWLDAMIAQAWTAPIWPAVYGRGGLSATDAMILQEGLQRANARPSLFSFRLWMLGPALPKYGTDAQKDRFLPKIVSGETRWCQGYSEPGAGADLAALRMRAEDKGDHWLGNGSNVWTTYAEKADWIFALVRTEASSAKHLGTSFLLIVLDTPGITVKPIELISGYSPYCETFFDDVKVPKDNMVGPLNGGWSIAKQLLQHERQDVSAVGFGGDRSVRIENLAKRAVGEVDGRIADGALRARIAQHNLYDRPVAVTTRRSQIETDSGSVGALTSVFKYASAKVNQARGELAVEILGLDGLGWSGANFAESDLVETRKWLRSKGKSSRVAPRKSTSTSFPSACLASPIDPRIH